jgi:hypothetical protein
MTELRALRSRPGATLTELLAGLTLGGLAATLVCGILVAQLRLARTVAERAAMSDATRIALAVVGGEAARLTGRDIRAASADSLALRSFRGSGVICRSEDDRAEVRYRGERLPDPRKDSVLVVHGVAAEPALGLLDSRGAAAGTCTPLTGETLLALRLSGPVPEHGLLIVFESGSYYISGRAVRYRLGAEGRQPLTAELFAHPASRFGAPGPAGIPLHLRTARGDTVSALAPFAGSLR